MLARLIFLLLFAANIGVGAWIVLGARAPRPAPPPSHDPAVGALVLLSEREPSGEAQRAELATAPIDVGSETCASLGPFATQSDMRRALNALTPLVSHIQFRETQSQESRGFTVFLPAPPTRDEALKLARQLTAKGVRDFYVVTAGERQNTISLGLFHDRPNADKRRDQLAQLGFAPTVEERSDTSTQYWLDWSTPRGHPIDWRAALGEARLLTAREVRCF